MNKKEILIIFFLIILLHAMMGYRSVSKTIDYNNIYRNKQYQPPPQLQFASSSSSSNYYVNPIIPNVSNDIIEALMKSRHPIHHSYENNLVDANDLFMKLKQQQKAQVYKSNKEPEEGKIHGRIIPFFWHIPGNGGGTISRLLGECLGLTIASSSSIHYNYKFDESEELTIHRYDNSIVVNVDLGTKEGIERASRLGVLQNDIISQNGLTNVHVVISPQVFEIPEILFENIVGVNGTLIQGSMFTMFRHPIEREVSYFSHLKRITSDEAIRKFEFVDWIRSHYFVDNVMVRALVNKLEKNHEVTFDDLLNAKEIIRRKCVIGLLEEKSQSWQRFRHVYEHYFVKSQSSSSSRKDIHNHKNIISTPDCENKLLSYDWPNRNDHRTFVDHDFHLRGKADEEHMFNNVGFDGISFDVYNEVKDLHEFDLILFEFAKYLYRDQGSFFE